MMVNDIGITEEIGDRKRGGKEAALKGGDREKRSGKERGDREKEDGKERRERGNTKFSEGMTFNRGGSFSDILLKCLRSQQMVTCPNRSTESKEKGERQKTA